MAFLDRLLHGRTHHEEPAPAPVERSGGVTTTRHLERDNRGTRHDSFDKASAYWVARMGNPHKDPFVLYTFDRQEDARAALLDLPVIHEAEDTGNLISTEVLIFGHYPTPAGKHEAIVCGLDLSHELWAQARDAFERHGGQRKNDLEPEVREVPVEAAKPLETGPAALSSKVVFDREERVEQMGVTFVYRIHHAPDAASAKAFLDEHPVVERNTYILVNTPEGAYGRDIDGMYRQ